MICAGTSMMCVMRSRSIVAMVVLRVELAQQHVGPAEVERRHQRDERAVEHDRPGCAACGTRASSGTRQAMSRQYIERTKWLCMMPFGSPVVPLVNMMLKRSSGLQGSGSNASRWAAVSAR